MKQPSNGSRAARCTLLCPLLQDNEDRRMDQNCTIPSTSWVVLLRSDDNRVHMRGAIMHLPHQGFHMVSDGPWSGLFKHLEGQRHVVLGGKPYLCRRKLPWLP